MLLCELFVLFSYWIVRNWIFYYGIFILSFKIFFQSIKIFDFTIIQHIVEFQSLILNMRTSNRWPRTSLIESSNRAHRIELKLRLIYKIINSITSYNCFDSIALCIHPLLNWSSQQKRLILNKFDQTTNRKIDVIIWTMLNILISSDHKF